MTGFFPTFVTTLLAGTALAERLNDFDVSNASVSTAKILSGGPPRDGIPAIDHPVFIKIGDVDFLSPDDEVLGFSVEGEARAYPLRILVWHEIVNDEIAGHPIAVTYCPLCGTAMVFSRKTGGRTVDFGVSGLLYQSDVLMYDRQTESLWSQLAMQAVSGPLVKEPLVWLPSVQTTWSAWKKRHPQGRVWSTDTGFNRNYEAPAYARYKAGSGIMFPVPEYRTELQPKAWVAGVMVGNQAFAFPLKELPPNEILEQKIDDIPIEVSYDPSSRQISVRNRGSGLTVPIVQVYWFAWQAFHPETELWTLEESNRERKRDAQSGTVGR